MLKITYIAENDARLTLRLEGRLVGQWVNALRSECEGCLKRRSKIPLDLSGVSFVDRQGVTTLKALRGQRVELVECSLFISELLQKDEEVYA